MAKLLRMHLVGVGHEDARFHPLPVRLDQNGVPMNSVINLRNGGGKTSLLSLIYAVLLPGKHDFLGKVNGSNRTLDDNFLLGKLGVVALEMESHVGRFCLMLAWVRREREDPPMLFSFRTGQDGISFDELPLQGLSSSPAKTLADLNRWLSDRHSKAPGNVDLYVASNFRDWHNHLKTQRGVDAHLYRSHLQMNKAEGAVDEEFKFSKTNDFIRRYLEFALEQPTMGRDGEDPVTASLNEHRHSLMKKPHYEKERDFIDEMVPHLKTLDGHGQRRRTAEADRLAAMSELQLLADGVSFLTNAFRAEQKHYEQDHAVKKDERDEYIRKRDNAKRHAAGYERRARELRISEAQKAYTTAKRTAQEHGDRAQALVAAKLWREVRGAKVKLDALVEQRTQLQQQLRPQLEEVQKRASLLNAAFEEAIEAAQLAFEEAKEREAGILADLTRERDELGTLKDEHSSLSADLSDIQSRIELANRARERLVADRVIQLREEAVDAEARLTAEVGRLENVAKACRTQAVEARTRATAHREQSARLSNLAAQARNLAEQARADVARFESVRDACAGLDCVKEILEGGPFDPFNQGVVEALRARESGHRKELLDLEIERAEDKRLLGSYDAEKHPLFPAPHEIEELVAQMRARGIRGVLTAYEWLNANATAEEARARLRTDPAAYGGLVANTADDLEAVRASFSEFQLSRPVRITLTTSLDGSTDTKAVTILPQRAGLFNAASAATERGQIVEHQGLLDAKAVEITQKSEAFAEAASQVSNLQKEFTAAWVEKRRSALIENTAMAREQAAAAAAESASAVCADQDSQRADSTAAEHEAAAGLARTQLSKVSDFRSTFGNHLESWLKRQNKLRGDVAANETLQGEIGARIRGLENDLPSVGERKTNAKGKVVELRMQKSNARLGAYLPPNPPSVPHRDIVAEELPFITARDTYEEKAQHGPLEAAINSAEQALGKAEGAFTRGGHGKRPEEVAGLSEATDLEVRLEITLEAQSKAKVAVTFAEQELQLAQKDRPKPLGVNERADLDPELPEPTSAANADRMKQEKQQLADDSQTQADALRDIVNDLETRGREAKAAVGQYETMADLTAPAKAEEPRQYPGFSGNPEEDKERIRSVKKRHDDAKKLVEDLADKMGRVFDNHIDLLVKDEKWDRFSLDIRDRFRRFTRADYEKNTPQHTADCNERKAGLVAKLEEIDKVRDTLIDQLYGRANEAVRSLEHAARLSRMPEGVGAWSGQPFLKVHVPARSSQAERRVFLGRLMDSWMMPQKKDMAIPRGAALAYECLLAIMNQREIEIEILKPEAYDPLACNYQPVTKLATFSGGQRVTAAILLYCVIVRVRADRGDILADCGFLMLDNPFGKASHFPLVDLQLKMANIMGVQLIYLTGINDFEALASFPLRVRLRNSVRNSANGERIVQAEPHTVEAVRLGEANSHGNSSRS